MALTPGPKLGPAEPPQPVLTGVAAELLNAYDWTPDGKLIVNRSDGARTGSLWIVPMDTRGRPEAYLPSTVRFGADVSPDGRWLAYAAGTDIGKAQIFLQTFPDARGGKWPVSAVGASHPRWSHDGRELYFRGGSQLMAVTVATLPRLEISQPKALFSIEEERGLRAPPSSLYPYDVMTRGEGFVYLASKTTLSDARVVVVSDWMRAAGIKH